jgi:Family of unknown function (DUF6390)
MSSGALRFVRYAYPPNVLGYCGPYDHGALFEYGTARVVDGGLQALARDFDGAWPYLELIARANDSDPLDEAVVEAYWIGGRLLRSVDTTSFGNSIEERFRRRSGNSWAAVSEAVAAGALPNHGFHVFCVYPWVGLMRTGMTDEPLRVLDRCRIRWGRIAAVSGDTASVVSRSLVLDGDRLTLGGEAVEEVTWASGGTSMLDDLRPQDRVTMHWDWVCERVTARAVHTLERETAAALALANRELARPRTGVLG